MTTRTEAGAEKSFVSALLPWIVAASVAVIYLLTLNHWLSFSNLQPVSRATGENWVPDINLPLFALVTSPFHWLPQTWVPLAMNFFSLVCAFFVLVLVARSVALLPQDRTQKQRERERGPFGLLSSGMAWLPPVLAVVVCGLQLTFWEDATSLSSGMIDLVMFAYSVRCLLEYRISKQESWLLRAAVVYAAACTDNWVLILLLPAFLASMAWMRGFNFFNLGFLSRLFLCFLGGLLVYLYLPLLRWRIDGFFWEPLKGNVSAQFIQIVYLCRYSPHFVQFLLALTSLLPIIFIGIRWKSSFGDTSELGIALATWVLHITHALLLIVCIGAAFDTGFGLRDQAGRFPMLDINRERFLALSYLSALSIGYFSGYFLVVFRSVSRRGRPATGPQKFLNRLSVGVICVLLVITPIGLLCKNVPAIRMTNGPAMRNYASALTEHLPPQAVLLSDSPAPLLLTRALLARSGKENNFIYLETHALRYPSYYRYQTRNHNDVTPQLSTNVTDATPFTDFDLLNLITQLAARRPVYYLNPSFGFFFEVFYPVPHGLTYELQRYTTNVSVFPPALSDSVVTENEAFWKDHDAELHALLPSITPPEPEESMGRWHKLKNTIQIPFEKNLSAVQLAMIYSRALNTWGVEAQRLGRLDSAAAHFDEAVRLSSGNIVAIANSEFNKKLRKGEKVTFDDPAAFENRFGKFSSWQDILNNNGMFDEPTGCLAEGIVFARGQLDREAAQNLQRALTLAPESLLARLWLARVYLVSREPAKAYPLIAQLKARSDSFASAAITPADILQLELGADYANTNLDQAQQLLDATLSQPAPDSAVLEVASRVCIFYRDYTNAIRVTDKQVAAHPENVTLLVNKGFLQIRNKDFDAAIPPLSKAVSLQPTNSAALYCRAEAYLQGGKLDEAQHDFETLQKLNPNAYAIYHGLAEVAYQKKDTNAAIHFYQQELANVAPTSPEAKFVNDRLKSLKNGSP